MFGFLSHGYEEEIRRIEYVEFESLTSVFYKYIHILEMLCGVHVGF